MSRFNYFGKGDEYSEFHRYIMDDRLKMIDLDCVEYQPCCNEIIFIGETARDKGQTYKNTTMTRKIAQGLKCRAYLIFYLPIAKPQSLIDEGIKELGYNPYISFRIARIDHLNGNSNYEFEHYTAEEWVSKLIEFRIRHHCVKD